MDLARFCSPAGSFQKCLVRLRVFPGWRLTARYRIMFFRGGHDTAKTLRIPPYRTRTTQHAFSARYRRSASLVQGRLFTCTVYPSNQITQEPSASRQSSLPSSVAQEAAKSTERNGRRLSISTAILTSLMYKKRAICTAQANEIERFYRVRSAFKHHHAVHHVALTALTIE